jgi:hypothetical protein
MFFCLIIWKSAKGQRARGKGVMLPLKGLLRASRLKLSCAVLHEVHSLFYSKVYNFRELKNISTAGSHVFGVIEQIIFFHIFPCEMLNQSLFVLFLALKSNNRLCSEWEQKTQLSYAVVATQFLTSRSVFLTAQICDVFLVLFRRKLTQLRKGGCCGKDKPRKSRPRFWGEIKRFSSVTRAQTD